LLRLILAGSVERRHLMAVVPSPSGVGKPHPPAMRCMSFRSPRRRNPRSQNLAPMFQFDAPSVQRPIGSTICLPILPIAILTGN
jgi:hypothetical protein